MLHQKSRSHGRILINMELFNFPLLFYLLIYWSVSTDTFIKPEEVKCQISSELTVPCDISSVDVPPDQIRSSADKWNDWLVGEEAPLSSHFTRAVVFVLSAPPSPGPGSTLRSPVISAAMSHWRRLQSRDDSACASEVRFTTQHSSSMYHRQFWQGSLPQSPGWTVTTTRFRPRITMLRSRKVSCRI